MDEPQKPSIFSALRPKSDPPPRPAPPPVAPPPPSIPLSPSPVFTPAPPPLPHDAAESSALLKRIKLLEERLDDSRQKEITAMETLRQTELAQKLARDQTEALLQSSAAQRKLEQAESQTRELLAIEQRRIAELEQKLMSAADAGMIEPLQAAVAALQVASASVARELGSIREEAADARVEMSRARTAAEAAAEGAVRRLRSDVERETAAAVDAAAARVERRADARADDKFAELDADRRAERIAVASETAKAREADRKALTDALTGLEKSLGAVGHASRDEFARIHELARRMGEKLDSLSDSAVRRHELETIRASFAELSNAPAREVTDAVQGIAARLAEADSSLQTRMSRFETEMRAAVYARLLDLERRIKLKD